MFLGCYVLAFWDLTTAMWASLAALFLRQIGHAVLEPPCHDKEALLLGFNTPSKTAILATYLLDSRRRTWWRAPGPGEEFGPMMAAVAREWFLWTGSWWSRAASRTWSGSTALRLALVWFVKLVTDPVTDLIAYSPRYLRRA